jgi:general stress protein 26
MEINYEDLKNEVISALEDNPVWVLSTSSGGYVTSRPMSIVHIGIDVYFQTNRCYIKHEQMSKNKQVALCCRNYTIEGFAEVIGDWKDDKNAELMELYKSKHRNSFEYYGLLDGQVVYRVTPAKVKMWKYINGKPVREVLVVNEKRAERLDFMVTEDLS